METLDKLKCVLDRTVPISDPSYIVGEEDAIKKLDRLFISLVHREQGLLGCVILGQIGNGKTHFLRYIRYYYESNDSSIGIYIPDMFVSGPLVDSLRGIYKSLFIGPGNSLLSEYYNKWISFKKDKPQEFYNENNIMKYLSICNNKAEEELVLTYYSNIDLIPDQVKFLRNKFGLKKRLISNENDFYKVIGDALEFIYILTNKNILLLFDEIDKIYSYDTNKLSLSRVQAKILSAYRGLFDALNNRKIKGIIVIGATPEAWDILSTQGAFERRFKDNKIILKVPKSKQDCIKFLEDRFDEINLKMDDNDKIIVEEILETLPETKIRTWAEVISNIKNYNYKPVEIKDEPVTEIIKVLNDAISPLTWNEIIKESELLQKIYPKSQPTTLIKKIQKENKIRILDTKPKTYEAINGDIND